MFKPVTFKEIVDQQYALQKRSAEIADKTAATLIDYLPKFPTPAELIDSSIEMNKLLAKTFQDELVNVAKNVYQFK